MFPMLSSSIRWGNLVFPRRGPVPHLSTLTLLLRLSGLWSLELETIHSYCLRKEIIFPPPVRYVLCLLNSCYPSLDLCVLCLLEARSREVPQMDLLLKQRDAAPPSPHPRVWVKIQVGSVCQKPGWEAQGGFAPPGHLVPGLLLGQIILCGDLLWMVPSQ